MRRQLHENPGAEIKVDLEVHRVLAPDGQEFEFEIDPFDKKRLLKGLADISLTLEYAEEIAAFEVRHEHLNEWIY